MMKSAILTTLIASVAAFAPVQQKAANTGTALNAFEDELGAQPPLGFYDPLGLLTDVDQERFDRLRLTEVKHGRVAMLAFLGNLITRADIHLPGAIDYNGDQFSSFPNGWAGLMAIPDDGVAQLLYFIIFLEASVFVDRSGEAEFPGDLRNGFIDFGWDKFDEDTKLKKRGIELNNGRAAMFGILGLMVHEQLGGTLPIVGEM